MGRAKRIGIRGRAAGHIEQPLLDLVVLGTVQATLSKPAIHRRQDLRNAHHAETQFRRCAEFREAARPTPAANTTDNTMTGSQAANPFAKALLAAVDPNARKEARKSLDRPRTNTPLQALVLMNDPTYVEAARALAVVALAAVPANTNAAARAASILDAAFRRLLARTPEPRERALLLERPADFRRRFAADRAGADRLLAVGTVRPPAGIPADELAAWSTVMNLLLCFDETLTKG